MSFCRSHFGSSQDHFWIKSILDQVMSFKDAAVEAAKDLVQSGDLQEMIDQKSIFMFDNMGA